MPVPNATSLRRTIAPGRRAWSFVGVVLVVGALLGAQVAYAQTTVPPSVVERVDATTPSDTITVNASDRFGNKATADQIAVTVNGLPVITAPAAATVGVGQSTSISGVSLAESGNTTQYMKTYTAIPYITPDTTGRRSSPPSSARRRKPVASPRNC